MMCLWRRFFLPKNSVIKTGAQDGFYFGWKFFATLALLIFLSSILIIKTAAHPVFFIFINIIFSLACIRMGIKYFCSASLYCCLPIIFFVIPFLVYMMTPEKNKMRQWNHENNCHWHYENKERGIYLKCNNNQKLSIAEIRKKFN